MGDGNSDGESMVGIKGGVGIGDTDISKDDVSIFIEICTDIHDPGSTDNFSVVAMVGMVESHIHFTADSVEFEVSGQTILSSKDFIGVIEDFFRSTCCFPDANFSQITFETFTDEQVCVVGI